MEPCYIGKGHGSRFSHHNKMGAKHYNPHLAAIYKKAGQPLPYTILRDGLTEAEAFEIETILIAALGRSDRGLGTLANMTDGGDGQTGYRHTDEAKEKNRVASLGNQYAVGHKWTDEERIARKAVMRGHVVSDAEREATRQRSTGNTYNLGKTRSEETKAKIRAANLGLKRSDETRAKISAAAKARKHSSERRQRHSERMKGNTFAAGHSREFSPETRAKLSAAKRAYWERKRQVEI